ncbi:MAG: hemerythrin family protein [Nitrospinota bacterium]|nr:hemerythrin family protein [Nitrospinota bacterium]
MSLSKNEKLAQDLAMLDAQHQAIEAILTDLEDLVIRQGPIGEQEAKLKELVNILHLHFNCENILFAEFGYPHITPHMKEHKRMLEEINMQYQMIKAGGKILSSMLTDYLLYLDKIHIAQMDQDYIDYFRKSLDR